MSPPDGFTPPSESEVVRRALSDPADPGSTQEVLRETLHRLGLAIRSADVGLWDWDMRSDKVFYSREWKRQLGYVDDEISDGYEEWESRLHPDDVDIAKGNIAEYLRDPLPCFGNEFRMRHKDGSYRWIYAQASLLTDDEGVPVRMMGSHIDVTERKQSEQAAQIIERLHELEAHHTIAEFLTETLDEVGRLLESPIGFYHCIDAGGESLSLTAWSTATTEHFCNARDRCNHLDLRDAGVWVDCIRERRPVIHNDYQALPHRRGLPEGHAHLVREAVVPIFRDGRVVAVLGIGNKSSDYTEHDVQLASHLGDVAWEIAEHRRAADPPARRARAKLPIQP